MSAAEIWQVPSKRNRRRGDDLVLEEQRRSQTKLRAHQEQVYQDQDQDEDRRGRRVHALSSAEVLFFCSGESR